MALPLVLLVFSFAAALAPQAEAREQMQVMGVGIGRTGTQTLRMALEMLGYKVMGDAELVWRPEVREMLLKAQATNDWAPVKEHLAEKGFNATTGLDVNDMNLDMWKAFERNSSGVKAILTVRPFEKWYRSIYQHQFWESRFMAHLYGDSRWADYCQRQSPDLLSALLVSPWLTTDRCPSFCIYWHRPAGKEHCRRLWDGINDKRRRIVPQGLLLEYNVEQGWEPLCEFLGVPVPFKPFPRYDGSTLTRKDFKRWRIYYCCQQAGLFFLYFCAPALCGLWWRRCCCGRGRRAGRKED